MSYRCQPQYDLKLVPHKDPGHGPRGPHDGGETAAVLINATLKGTFAPVALPKREFMENAQGDLGAARPAAAHAASRRGTATTSATGRQELARQAQDGDRERLFLARPGHEQ